MITINKSKRIIDINKIAHVPGLNLFSLEQQKQILKKGEFEKLQKIPDITVYYTPKKPFESIVEIPEEELLPLLDDTYAIKTIDKMKDQELSSTKPRPKVLDKLNNQKQTVLKD